MKDRLRLGALIAIGFALIGLQLIGVAHAGDVKITWTHDTATCADGSPGANCPPAGFQINQGTSLTGALTPKENVGAGLRTVTYTGIAPGTTTCFSLNALSGTSPSYVKSDESPRSCVTMPYLPPKAPAGVTVTVQITVSTGSPPTE